MTDAIKKIFKKNSNPNDCCNDKKIVQVKKTPFLTDSSGTNTIGYFIICTICIFTRTVCGLHVYDFRDRLSSGLT